MALDQVEISLDRWRGVNEVPPPGRGWVQAIRSALGMTLAQLARRVGVAVPTLAKIERGEQAGTVSLNTLKRVAQALDCDLVYALVPRKPLRQKLRDRAEEIARRRLARVSHSMSLEAQQVSGKARDRQLELLTREILEKRPRDLWD
ncbi:MAG: mobile mystery protein A [Betaproteobacteria bacterium]|nr:mobile mystery protein A [Betaproteobacteria bacterium]